MVDVLILYEEVVLLNISFMEVVYVCFYSFIFFMLCYSKEVDVVFVWSESCDFLQCKVQLMLGYYQVDELLKKKIVSVFFEFFFFYFGFWLLMYFFSWGKLINIVDLICLIICDEVVYGYYIGYKYQKGLEIVSFGKCEELKNFVFDLLMDFYDNELVYSWELYGESGWFDDVSVFLCYNVNKVLMNFGYEVLFLVEMVVVNLVIFVVLLFNVDENYDFFFGFGFFYVIGKMEEIVDDDWDF